MNVSEDKTRERNKVINLKGPPHPGTNTVLRTRTLTPVVKAKTIGSKKEQRKKSTFYVLYSKRNWFHRTFIFIQPFHLHRDPNLNSVILVRAASQRIPGRFLMLMRGTAPPCGIFFFYLDRIDFLWRITKPLMQNEKKQRCTFHCRLLTV